MSKEMNHELSPADIAIQLDLKSKVHRLEEAERYFSSIPETCRDFKVYCALLNCYSQHRSLEKAEGIMQKIRHYGSSNAIDLTMSYNVMLKLYARLGKYEELDRLIQVMKDKRICNTVTYHIRLNAYATAVDVEGMEKFLMQMEADGAPSDWFTYAASANTYLKAGLSEKAIGMLKRSELYINRKTRRIPYETLLAMYASAGNKQEVYRVWNVVRNLGNSRNSVYLYMIRALVKLDDIDGAERILEEWESENTCFDTRIPNLIIHAYCKKGLLEKAESFISRALKIGMNPDGTTWTHLANGYSRHNHMEKAVKMVKSAIMADRPAARLYPFTLSACIEHLTVKGDLEFAGDIIKLCRERGIFSAVTNDRLFDYLHNNFPETTAFDVIKQDYVLDKNDQHPDGENQGLGELREENILLT